PAKSVPSAFSSRFHVRNFGSPARTRSGSGAPSSGSMPVRSKSRNRLIRSDLGKSLFDIGYDIVGILDADRQAHDIRTSASRHFLLVAQLPMCGRGRMNHERTRVADIVEQREPVQAIHE